MIQSNQKPSSAKHGWYALRRTLPPHTFEENLAELMDLASPMGLDEVMIIVDPEEFNHGHTPLAWLGLMITYPGFVRRVTHCRKQELSIH